MKRHKNSTVLVTGATGYLASHTIVELLNNGYEVIGIDNLASSKKSVISRIIRLTDRSLIFRNVDIRDREKLEEIFDSYEINGVIHFAGYKAVGESVENPMLYYSNNLAGSITLFDVMNQKNVKSLVFSSSCTVYGDSKSCPVTEQSELNPTNPYGRTKFYTEQVLKDLSNSDSDWQITCLRYFNPIGAHPSGKLGEDPLGIPNNLFPYITQTAIGDREKLQVFGGDYATKDGTCVRDYIHVCDLASGHIAAMESIESSNFEVINLGTGKGYSVLEVIKTFEKVTGYKVPYTIVDRREGDAAEVFANPEKAYKKLYWKAEKGLEEMCSDAWKWQMNFKNEEHKSIPSINSSDFKSYSSNKKLNSTKTRLNSLKLA